jgi:hypothetical protein
MNSTEIESILRQAPQPKAPAGLRDRLIAEAPSRGVRPAAGPAFGDRNVFRSWLARWWPALVPAGISLACAAVFTVQQAEIRGLKQALQAMPEAASGTETGASGAAPSNEGNVTASVVASEDEPAEISRLKQRVSSLASEVSKLEQMNVENARLRQRLASSGAGFLTSEETKALEDARDRASAIQCVNNLKQLGLAVRVWANSNGEMTPPNLLAMTNEMSTPRILVCPGDSGRQPAADWSTFTADNCSYEYLAPSVPAEREPSRVLFRCPIHGSLCLLDGSAQMQAARKYPQALVSTNGALYFQHATISAGPTGQAPGVPPPAANP